MPEVRRERAPAAPKTPKVRAEGSPGREERRGHVDLWRAPSCLPIQRTHWTAAQMAFGNANAEATRCAQELATICTYKCQPLHSILSSNDQPTGVIKELHCQRCTAERALDLLPATKSVVQPWGAVWCRLWGSMGR